MKHEKVLKREDGTQYKIDIDVYIEYIRDGIHWNYGIQTKSKGKSKWQNLPYGVDASELVSEEEVYEAKLELWEKLKPTR